MIRKPNVQERLRKFHGVLTKFTDAMSAKAKRMHLEGGSLSKLKWEADNVSLDDLLTPRRWILLATA